MADGATAPDDLPVNQHSSSEYHPVLLHDGQQIAFRDWWTHCQAEEGSQRPWLDEHSRPVETF